MVDLYPISDVLSTDVAAGAAGHPALHNAERKALNTIKDYISGMGIAPLDLFAIGGNDQQKLVAAMDYCANIPSGRHPRIAMGNRIYDFTASIGQPYDGFHLEGVGRGQQGSIAGSVAATKKQHTTLHIEVPRAATGKPGYFINVTNDVARDYYIAGFSAYSDNGVTQMYRAPYVAGVSTGFGECNFYDQTFQNFYSVFGNESEGCSMTICDIKGGWLIFECRSTGVHIQGSDNRNIFGDGIDWYQSDLIGQGNGKFMGIFNALGKSSVGGLYITAYGTWRGLKIAGSTNTGLLDMSGAVIEGNNAGQPCIGSLIRVEGSANVAITRTTVDDGMYDPSTTGSINANGINDRGLIEIIGTTAQVSLTDMAFAHATGVAVTTPVVYNESPKTMLARFQTFTRGPAWGSQKPVVKGVTPLLSDATMSLVA